MTFVKKLWKEDGTTPITAVELNRMETGIDDADTSIFDINFRLDHMADLNVLWAAAAGTGNYPVASTTITPTKKLSECTKGWILMWSDYDPGVANDYDWFETTVSKYRGLVGQAVGKTSLFIIPNFSSTTSEAYVIKRLTIYDDRIVGHDDNSASGTEANDVVLRAVVEW